MTATTNISNGTTIESLPTKVMIDLQQQQQQHHQIQPQLKVDPETVSHQFVNEYYTFMNKDPAKLHCFYNKRSHMIHGVEGQPVTTCIGQQEIHDLIASLDYQNCQLLINNVDYQPSANGSVFISVMGSLSNKGGPARRFVQTFLLAEQPNGYYVLNDIFRFFKEDNVSLENGDVEVVEAAPAVEHREEEYNEECAQAVPVEPNYVEEVTVSVPEEKIIINETVVKSVPVETEATAVNIEIDDSSSSKEAKAIPLEKLSPTVAAAEDISSGKKGNKSWATLAASEQSKWGIHVSNANKGTVSSVNGVANGDLTPKSSASTPSNSNRKDSGKAPRKDSINDQQHLYMIFIKGVPEEITGKDLYEYFNETIGNVRNAETNSKNYAVVEFKSIEDAKKAIGVKFTMKGKEFVTEERRPRSAAYGNNNGSGGSGRKSGSSGAGSKENGSRRDRRNNRNSKNATVPNASDKSSSQ